MEEKEYREGPEVPIEIDPIINRTHQTQKEPLFSHFDFKTTSSTSIEQFAEAMALAQSQMTHAIKDSQNPYFKSSYADLSQVIDVIRPALTENGISFMQWPNFDGSCVYVTTRLMHKSGQFIQSSLSLRPTKNDPQSIGSAITYARRYSLSSICGIAQDDDDGNSASGAAPRKTENALTTSQLKELENAFETFITEHSLDKDELTSFIKDHVKSNMTEANIKMHILKIGAEGYKKALKNWQSNRS